MAHPNEELLRRQDEAQARGDVEGIFADFADDVLVHVAGRSKLSGDYKGKAQVMELFGRFMQSLGEDPVLETHDILANDTHGVVLQTYRGKRGSDTIATNGVGVFHFGGGKITEAWFIDEDPYTADPWYDAGL